MNDDLIPPLYPTHASTPINHFEAPHPRPHHAGITITGKIVAVSHGHPHHDEAHQLDVSVGGSAFTELVIRVPNAAYGHLEGRHVVIHIEPA